MAKKDDSSPYFKDWTKRKLVDEYKGTYQLIHEVGCYGCSDLRYLDGLENEIARRGYQVSTSVDVS